MQQQQPELTQEQQLIAIAQALMTRAEIKGHEVDAYAQAFNFLQGIMDGTYVVVPAPQPELDDV